MNLVRMVSPEFNSTFDPRQSLRYLAPREHTENPLGNAYSTVLLMRSATTTY
jgi:hypothetical protein